jgi:hypothetical protein
MAGTDPQRYLAPATRTAGEPTSDRSISRVFPAAGWAAVRTHLHDSSRDVALLFRSSPYGAISHSHANNNDFIIHVGGKVMAMPSGYYDGYGSDHHTHWVWHTKSHNCITLSDAGQIMHSHDSRGAVESQFEDEQLVYFRGNADESYRDRARRCRRHVLFLKKSDGLVMVDEFVAVSGILSAVQWNIHSWNRPVVNEAQRTFLIEREGSSLEGHLMYHHHAFFSVTESWDPPPLREKDSSQWHQQHHLRFTPQVLVPRLNLGVVLCPGHAFLSRAQVHTERADTAEVARIGEDLVVVNQDRTVEFEGLRSDALVLLVIGGHHYEVRDEGLKG